MSDTDLLSSATADAASRDNEPGEQPNESLPQAVDTPAERETSGHDTAENTDNGAPIRRRGGLSGMVLAELRELAGQLGITGTAGMRKGDLIAAIKQRQGGGNDTDQLDQPSPAEHPEQLPLDVPAQAPRADDQAPEPQFAEAEAVRSDEAVRLDTVDNPENVDSVSKVEPTPRITQRRRAASRPAGAPDPQQPVEQPAAAQVTEAPPAEPQPAQQQPVQQQPIQQQPVQQQPVQQPVDSQPVDQEPADRRPAPADQRPADQQSDGGQQDSRPADRGDGQQADRGEPGPNGHARDDDGDEAGGRRRGRRFRDRRRNRGDRRPEGGGTEPEVREDDVLLPVAGILDVLENYAFVRTSGYLAGPNDVYVSLSLVRKYGLRRGDAITGAVRQPREGEQQRQKFNPLVRVDTINGLDVDAARQRPEFTKLTPLYPNERLRLETESHKLTTRIIDLVMPVGKGQRALIVSPPKAGKTMVLQAIANAITTNNPECHLMVVLVDERPEEVTDMQRSVKGEVIASTFDRPPSDHTTISELAIERAKRLVEMGHDVVVLLDSITRLGRAYNLAAPASGRILSGGVDSTALYPPKRFLGAARNIEGGGSLTIFATALVETGSTGDGVIFEEFKGTGNAELKLDRKISDRRVFPAVDVSISSTRKEELLLSPDEMAVTTKLRRVLSALDPQQAIDLLLDRLRKTRTNVEFLMQVAKTTPLTDDD